MSAEGRVLGARPTCVFECECGTSFRAFCQHPAGMTVGGNGPAEVQHCAKGTKKQIFGNVLFMEEMRNGSWTKTTPDLLDISR